MNLSDVFSRNEGMSSATIKRFRRGPHVLDMTTGVLSVDVYVLFFSISCSFRYFLIELYAHAAFGVQCFPSYTNAAACRSVWTGWPRLCLCQLRVD